MKQTPLTARHRAMGAKMVEYAGFEMPVQYTGLVEEHLTVRSSVGIFDLTHMGEFEVTGPGALDTVNRLGSNDASQLKVGEIQYTCLTNERGGIIDDILAYRTEQGFCWWSTPPIRLKTTPGLSRTSSQARSWWIAAEKSP